MSGERARAVAMLVMGDSALRKEGDAMTFVGGAPEAVHRRADHRDSERGRGGRENHRALPTARDQRTGVLPLEGQVRRPRGQRGTPAAATRTREWSAQTPRRRSHPGNLSSLTN